MLLTPSLRIADQKSISVVLLILASLLFVCVRAMGSGSMNKDRAIVLGGGGPVGEAWESGIISGLADKSIDLSGADLILGTSAGAIVGARVASRMPRQDFIDGALAPSAGPPPGKRDQASSGPPPDLTFLAGKLHEMEAGKRSEQSIRAEIGEWALKARPVVSEPLF